MTTSDLYTEIFSPSPHSLTLNGKFFIYLHPVYYFRSACSLLWINLSKGPVTGVPVSFSSYFSVTVSRLYIRISTTVLYCIHKFFITPFFLSYVSRDNGLLHSVHSHTRQLSWFRSFFSVLSVRLVWLGRLLDKIPILGIFVVPCNYGPLYLFYRE